MIIPDDLIRFAGKLAAPSQGDESQYRAAISRAYYGAFHGACEFFRRIAMRASHNHGEVQRWFQQCGHPRALEAGNKLVDLHSWRIKADYELGWSSENVRQQALDCVESASEFRSILNELDVPDQRELVKAGIEAYRQRIRPT